jgi:cell division protein FtsA
MTERISIGIDVGTHNVKVMVCVTSAPEHKTKPKIVGMGIAPSKGLHHGYVVDIEEAAKSIKTALTLAEKTSGYKITKAYLAIGGLGLTSGVFSSSLNLGEKESEITEGDMRHVLENTENELPESFILNKKIIHAIPLQYKIDGKVTLGKPQGMQGEKLEVKVLFVTCLSQHLDNLVDALHLCEIEIEDVVASPLASSLVTLGKTQQMAGCILVDIGAETVSASVFENGTPVSLEVFPIGSIDITNDIALGLKIPLEDAEKVKVSKPESVPYPRKKIEEIVGARLSDIFDLVEAHLKKIGRNGLLPAGIIMTGGGSYALHAELLAKNYLKIPAKRSHVKFDLESSSFQTPKDGVKENIWTVSYGLCILGTGPGDNGSPVGGLGRRWVNKTSKNIWSWIKRMLP